MSDDQCGSTDTADGQPCEQPASKADGRCHFHTDIEDEQADDPGRPSKLDEYGDQIIQAAKQGMALNGCARIAGVDESTLHRWKDKYDDFAERLLRARAQGELKHIQSVNERGSQFLLERSFGYTKTEKREVDADHTHDASERYAELVGEASSIDE
jgi:transposase-like protein